MTASLSPFERLDVCDVRRAAVRTAAFGVVLVLFGASVDRLAGALSMVTLSLCLVPLSLLEGWFAKGARGWKAACLLYAAVAVLVAACLVAVTAQVAATHDYLIGGSMEEAMNAAWRALDRMFARGV